MAPRSNDSKKKTSSDRETTVPGAGIDRRGFVRVAGLGAAGLAGAVTARGGSAETADPRAAAVLADPDWPSPVSYTHLTLPTS